MTLPGTIPRIRARAPAVRLETVAPFLLTALAFLVFGSGLRHELTNWDDQQYIASNHLIRGLSWDRIVQAFSRFHVFNYNPLHIVSYMVDHELWGLRPGGIFLTGLVLHSLTGVLVYRLALRWLASAGAALVVAALFLVHPTRVESVAWLSERKDVLSGLFAIAAVLAYSRHARSDGCGAAYWGSLGLYLLALLSKSQLVTLPLVFIAMELKSLSRSPIRRPWRRAIASQAPFLALSVAFAYISVRAHAGESLRGVSFPGSIVEPLAALPRYLGHLLWPFGLSPYYEADSERRVDVLMVVFGAALLAASIVTAWRSYWRRGVWFLGLVWFHALLLPVSGIVRLNILVADRYLYLSGLGLLLPAAASILELRVDRRLLAAGATAAVLVCAAASAAYVTVFASSESLWRHVLAVSPSCSIAYSNLGHHLLSQGRLEEAALCYDADLKERPYFESSFLGRALIYEDAGDAVGALRMYELALEKRPRSALVRTQMADYLDRQGQPRAALDTLRGLDRADATPAYCHKLFDLCWKLGLLEDARAAASLGRELAPHDPDSRERWNRVQL